MNLCWTAFKAILVHMQPVGHGLNKLELSQSLKRLKKGDLPCQVPHHTTKSVE